MTWNDQYCRGPSRGRDNVITGKASPKMRPKLPRPTTLFYLPSYLHWNFTFLAITVAKLFTLKLSALWKIPLSSNELCFIILRFIEPFKNTMGFFQFFHSSKFVVVYLRIQGFSAITHPKTS